VDPGTLNVLGRVATGKGPHEVVVSADGKYAVVANYSTQCLGNPLSIVRNLKR